MTLPPASSDTDDEVIQIKSDEQVALSLQEEFNREISVSDLELSQLHEGIDHQSAIDDESSIVKALEGKSHCTLYLEEVRY